MANKIKQWVHKFQSQDHAAVTLITALLLAILIGFLGLATDTSYAFYVRTKMQAAADAAALGGASNMLNGGSKADAAGVAQSLATLNGFKDGESFTSVTTLIPPGPNPDGSTPSYSNDTAYVRVQIAQSVRLFFAPLIGFANTWTVRANAVAGFQNSPDCLVTRTGFRINGNNTATLNNCSAAIGGNLDATNKAAITVNGNGNIGVYNNGSINCSSCTPTPTSKNGAFPSLPSVTIPSGLAVVSDPSCASLLCQPGIYNTQLTLNKGSSYTFASGFYQFNKGLVTNSATVTSAPNGVTLYIASNQPIDLSGSLTLTAQTPAGCAPGSGILVFQAPSNINSMSLAGSKDQLNLTGILNLPYSDITISGSSSNLTLSGSLVANSLRLNGNMNPSVSSNPCNNFVSQNKVSLVQ